MLINMGTQLPREFHNCTAKQFHISAISSYLYCRQSFQRYRFRTYCSTHTVLYIFTDSNFMLAKVLLLHGMTLVAVGHFSLFFRAYICILIQCFIPVNFGKPRYGLRAQTSLPLRSTHAHTQLCTDKCADERKQTCKKTDLYGWLDSGPTKCQIGRCSISSDLFDVHLFALSREYRAHDHINCDSAKCYKQVECILAPG